MEWLCYERGGTIQDRPLLRSAWTVRLPALGNLEIGRVESYQDYEAGVVRWRSLDHWFCDFRESYRTREAAAQELLTQCPRTLALVARTKEHRGIATGAPPA